MKNKNNLRKGFSFLKELIGQSKECEGISKTELAVGYFFYEANVNTHQMCRDINLNPDDGNIRRTKQALLKRLNPKLFS